MIEFLASYLQIYYSTYQFIGVVVGVVLWKREESASSTTVCTQLTWDAAAILPHSKDIFMAVWSLVVLMPGAHDSFFSTDHLASPMNFIQLVAHWIALCFRINRYFNGNAESAWGIQLHPNDELKTGMRITYSFKTDTFHMIRVFSWIYKKKTHRRKKMQLLYLQLIQYLHLHFFCVYF